MMMLMNDPVGRSLLSSHLTPSAASWHLKGRDYHHHHPDQHDHFLHQYKVMFSGGRPPSNGLKWSGIKFPGNHSQQHSAKQHSAVQYPVQCNTQHSTVQYPVQCNTQHISIPSTVQYPVQYPAQCNTLCNGALTCTMHNFAFYCHLSCKKKYSAEYNIVERWSRLPM